MPEKPPDLEQVIRFVYQLDEASVQKALEDSRQATSKRIAETERQELEYQRRYRERIGTQHTVGAMGGTVPPPGGQSSPSKKQHPLTTIDIVKDIGRGLGFSPIGMNLDTMVKLLNDLKELYKESLRRTAETVAPASGGLVGAFEGGRFEQTRRSIQELAVAFPDLKEAMETATKEIYQIIPSFNPKELKSTLQMLAVESTQTGISMKELTDTTTFLIRDMNLNEVQARQTVMAMHNVAERMQRAHHTLSTAEVDKAILEASKNMRLFGSSLGETTHFVEKMGDALYKHTVSVEQLVQMATGAFKKDEGTRAFLAQEFFKGLQGPGGDRARAATGGDAIAQMRAMEIMARGEMLPGATRTPEGERLRQEMGLTLKQARELHAQAMAAPEQLAAKFATQLSGGGGTRFGREARQETIQRMLEADWIGMSKDLPQTARDQLRAMQDGKTATMDIAKEAGKRTAIVEKANKFLQDIQSDTGTIKNVLELGFQRVVDAIKGPNISQIEAELAARQQKGDITPEQRQNAENYLKNRKTEDLASDILNPSLGVMRILSRLTGGTGGAPTMSDVNSHLDVNVQAQGLAQTLKDDLEKALKSTIERFMGDSALRDAAKQTEEANKRSTAGGTLTR